MASSIFFFSSGIFFSVSARLSLVPVWSDPVIVDLPRGSLKYPATACRTFSLVFISHSTMNSDIIAVTKSAYATFHAPP